MRERVAAPSPVLWHGLCVLCTCRAPRALAEPPPPSVATTRFPSPKPCAPICAPTRGLCRECTPLAAERCHYQVPHSQADVILFRSHAHRLFASTRAAPTTKAAWSPVEITTIPDVDANLNCGALPDSRGIFLVSNAIGSVHPNDRRDPLTIALSADGANFSFVAVVQTCTNLPLLPSTLSNASLPPEEDVVAAAPEHGEPSSTSHALGHARATPIRTTCVARQTTNVRSGPCYPQAVSVVGPGAPPSMRGLYVIASNNVEDVVVSRVPWTQLEVFVL